MVEKYKGSEHDSLFDTENFILHVNGQIAPHYPQLSIAAINLGKYLFFVPDDITTRNEKVVVFVMGKSLLHIAQAVDHLNQAVKSYHGQPAAAEDQDIRFNLSQENIPTHERILRFY